jgi:class 3 adenylate cyclase
MTVGMRIQYRQKTRSGETGVRGPQTPLVAPAEGLFRHMRCETCQHQNPDDASFCVNCGSLLTRSCPKCARRNTVAALFCAGCGLNFHGGRPKQPVHHVEAAPPSPVLQTRAARDGERKHVTVLFADMAGSTALIETLDAEDAAERLGSITSAMREAVARFEGTVNKMQGDGIMALFGAPIPQEDHAVRACCAALAMIENVRARADAPAIRVGIHTGEVIVRAVSNDISAQYEALGVTVHIAARLEQEAEELGVALSGATVRAAGGAIVADAIGDRRLRGVSDPLPVYALKGIRSGGRNQQFQGGQRLSPFVGRDLEQTILQRALEAANAGASRVVGIVGEPGSGKSRFVFEFVETCRLEGRPILEARATAHGRVTPLQTVLELMRGLFGITEDMPETTAADRVRQTMTRFSFAVDTPLMLDFMGLPRPPDEGVPDDVTARRLRLLEAVRRLARAVATSRASVVVVEDLHWLDPASESFIEALADGVAGTKSLLLVDFRPGYRASWMERSFYEQISLVPLAVSALGAMLDHLLGGDASLQPLRRRLIERAAGNPFFTEELVRALIEQGVLSGPPGQYRAPASAQDAPLPSTVQSLLGARIDRLDEVDKLLIQAAAVVGREFPLPVVASIAEMTVDVARASVHRLHVMEMIYERLDVQRDEFAFHHPLVQEAAYLSLLTDRRQELHRRTAASLAAHYHDRAGEFAALVAHHWEEARDVMQASAAYVKAALWIGTRDPTQALEIWRRVRRLLESAPASPPVDYMTMMACGQIVNYAWRAGIDAAEIEPVFQQAMTLARNLKDMRAAALITMAYGRALVATGSADDYVAKVEEAQHLIRGQALPSVEAVLAAVYSHAVLTAGLLPAALQANTRALTYVHLIEPRDSQTLGFNPEQWLNTQRAQILMLLGENSSAEALVDTLLKAESVDTLHRAIALAVRIESASRTGRPAQALEDADRLSELLRGNETPYLKVLGNRFQAIALLANGSAEPAVTLLTDTLAYARKHRAGGEMEPFLLATLAKALALTRDRGAHAAATEAVAVAKRRAMRAAEQDAIQTVQQIALHRAPT